MARPKKSRRQQQAAETPKPAAAARQATRATARPSAQTDYLYYLVPPVLLAAIFLFIASNQTDKANITAAATPTAKSSSSAPVQSTVAEPPANVIVIPADVNNDHAPYSIPAGSSNILTSDARASQSGYNKSYPAQRAIDGSLANDDQMSIANYSNNNPAWWQADISSTSSISTIVVYGGGSASTGGKLVGGFRIDIEGADGQRISRSFNEMGFALEGYEAWKLDQPIVISNIRITSLNPSSSLVLREVQALTAAP